MTHNDSAMAEQVSPVPASSTSCVARALYIGERIDLRKFSQSPRVTAQLPASVQLDDGGKVFLFRYGAAVFIDGTEQTRKKFLLDLMPQVQDPYERPETEEVTILISADRREGIEAGTVVLRDASNERLQAVAAVLAKAVALAQYEADVSATFDRIEPFAIELAQGKRGGRNMRLLLRHIGQALLNEHKMVARVEVSDRPELLWEHPEFEQLYMRLEDEFEIEERASILDRKLELISRTVETTLDLVQTGRSMRVEWYIVILIVLELILSIYSLIAR